MESVGLMDYAEAVSLPYLFSATGIHLFLNNRMQVSNRAALGRLGKPSDVAGHVSFLASLDADFISGALQFLHFSTFI